MQDVNGVPGTRLSYDEGLEAGIEMFIGGM